jgi:hypothetical protein
MPRRGKSYQQQLLISENMYNLLSTLVCTALLSANYATTSPSPEQKTLPFKATALVTPQNRIWLTVEKPQTTRVAVFLRSPNHAVLFQELLRKNQREFLIKLDVSDLPDGDYELEVKSMEGSLRRQVKVMTFPEENEIRQIAVIN